MFLNYFRIAFRNIIKDKISSVINIAGLAVGIACFMTLSLFILDEMSFDRFYKNSDRIYRVYIKMLLNGKEDNNSKTPGLLGPTLAQQFPEVQNFTRVGYFGQYLFRYNDKVFTEGNIYGVDSSFFDVFSLDFIYGDSKTALIKPNTLVITESAAKRYFGDENPVGKTLIVEKAYAADYLNQVENYHDNSEGFLITGLIKDFPSNSHFSTEFLTSISTYEINRYWLDLWYSTYVVLNEGTNPDDFEQKLTKVVEDNIGPLAESIAGISLEEFLATGNKYEYRLQPLNSIYLRSSRDYGIDMNTEWAQIKSSDITYTYIFSAVALFILLIAIINFMNLATARSERRAKEVGIRKTLGSNKLNLILQFISEAIMMSGLSVLIALALLEIILPSFNNLTGKELKLEHFSSFYIIPIIICFILFVGILAGSYPAFYLSSFQPVDVLKNVRKGNRKSRSRSALVIFQFAVSITLLIGTIIIKNQLDYIQNKNLGFNKEHLFSIMNANVLGSHTETFKQELLKNANILSATNSSQMFRAGIPGSGYLFNKKTGTDPIILQYVEADYDFLETYQIKLKEGRFFSKEFSTDTSAVLINESAAKLFRESLHSGDNNPVGKELIRIGRENWAKTFNIIGIIKDFNYESLHRQIRPLVIHLYPEDQPANVFTVRIASADMKNTLAYIEETWRKFVSDEGMWSRFVDENIARLYRAEENTSIVATVFSSLAIFIACLGLFGLATFVTEQRTKEIGIRKVLGASITEIVMLLSKEFAVWVLVANLIAWPVAYYVMQNWLQNFAFRIDLSFYVFIISGVAALLIALLTISLHAVKAASTNPVDSLRNE